MSPLAPSERRLRARRAANARWARLDTAGREQATAPARAAAEAAMNARLTEQYGLDPEAPDYGARLRNARRAELADVRLASMTRKRGRR